MNERACPYPDDEKMNLDGEKLNPGLNLRLSPFGINIANRSVRAFRRKATTSSLP